MLLTLLRPAGAGASLHSIWGLGRCRCHLPAFIDLPFSLPGFRCQALVVELEEEKAKVEEERLRLERERTEV